MGFLHSCFIRKNTEEVKKKLICLGIMPNDLDDDDGEWLISNYGLFISIRKMFRNPFPEDIDCGENESLFLAIAAIRNDSDIYQWFTDGENWIYCEGSSIAGHLAYYDTEINPDTLHKATVNELINHFK